MPSWRPCPAPAAPRWWWPSPPHLLRATPRRARWRPHRLRCGALSFGRFPPPHRCPTLTTCQAALAHQAAHLLEQQQAVGPFQRGSSGGKWRPMSPKLRAPSRASIRACTSTSSIIWASSPKRMIQAHTAQDQGPTRHAGLDVVSRCRLRQLHPPQPVCIRPVSQPPDPAAAQVSCPGSGRASGPASGPIEIGPAV